MRLITQQIILKNNQLENNLRKNLFWFSLFITYILNNSFANEFFPDDVNTTGTFVMEPRNDPNNYNQLVEYDLNTSKMVDLNATLVESLADRMGFLKPSNDINLTKSQDLKGYINSIKLKMPAAGNTIADQLKDGVQKFDQTNLSTYSNTAIMANDENTSLKKAIISMQDFQANVRSKMANIKTVDCYVTRKLVNSYFCPLPSMYNSFFRGGSAKDAKETSQESCEKLCQEPSSCLYKDMGKDLTINQNYSSLLVKNGTSILIDADSKMLGKYIELDFKTKYQYDQNISVDSAEYNETKALEALRNNKIRFSFDALFKKIDLNELEYFISNKTVYLDDLNFKIKIYLDIVKSEQYKINFFDPYSFKTEKPTIDENVTIELVNSKLEYVDNKYWFCSSKHFVENANTCAGTIKTVLIGSTTYQVCVTKEAQERESEYGAYYTQQHCEADCVIKAKCLPTYRHLDSFDPLSLPPELGDIDVGCIDSPINTSCNVNVCKQLFLDDVMPLTEKSWINDDSIKITVSNGVEQPDTVRPRIDIAGGLSANGDLEERKKTSIREMTDVSYANMIELNNFNISKNPISVASEFKNAYSIIPNGASQSVYWLLKPNSFHVDDQKNYYLYQIYEIDTVYRPMYGSYNTSYGVQTGTTDPDIRLQDKIYILKGANGYKIFKRVDSYLGKFRETICDNNNKCTYKYTWGPINEYMKIYNETFLSGQYVAFDINSEADYFKEQKFISDKKWENNLGFSSIEEIASVPGVLFNSQLAQNNGKGFTKVYSGEKNVLEQSSFISLNTYGFYSDKKLTYEEVFEKLIPSNRYYSTQDKLPQDISHDGAYQNDKIKFYVAGKPDNMSLNVDFFPSSKEEGKKTFIFMLLFDEAANKSTTSP